MAAEPQLTVAHAPSAADRGKAVWALLLASSVLYFFSTNTADNDLWGHVLFGRNILAGGAIPAVDTYSYTAFGRSWVNHEWLSQAVLAAVYQGAGAGGLLMLKFIGAAATFLLLFGIIRRRATTPCIWGVVGLLSIAVLSRGFAIRPQIFTYCALALVLERLDRYQRGERRALWLLPPLFVVWANLHGGFVLGLGILGLFAGATLIDAASRSPRPWIALAFSTAFTVVNPFGSSLFLFVWNELRRGHPITEWQAAHLSDASQFVFFAMFGVLVATLPFATSWRRDGWQTLLALGLGWLAVRHQRHTPVFALCAAAPLAAQLEHAGRWLAQRAAVSLGTASQRLIAGALGALALMQVAFTGARLWRDGLQIVFDPSEYPTAAVRALQQSAAHANLAVPLDWGEYVLWFLAPQVRVSLDGRFATVFSERVVEDNFDFFSGAPGWRRLLEQYPTDTALVPVDSPCPIAREPGWQRVYSDTVAALYVRSDRAASMRVSALRGEPAAGSFP